MGFPIKTWSFLFFYFFYHSSDIFYKCLISIYVDQSTCQDMMGGRIFKVGGQGKLEMVDL